MDIEQKFFWIDDRRSDEVGIVIQRSPFISDIVPRVETYQVPGRNGDLHVYDGTFENRTISIPAYIYDKNGVMKDFARLNDFLFSKNGYRKISFDGDLEHFWLGRIVNAAEIETRLGKLAPFNIEFDCKPQRFLTSGEDVLSFERVGESTSPSFPPNFQEIYNPTGRKTKPLLRIHFSMSLAGEGQSYYGGLLGYVILHDEQKVLPDSIPGTNLDFFGSIGELIQYRIEIPTAIPNIEGSFLFDTETLQMIFSPFDDLKDSTNNQLWKNEVNIYLLAPSYKLCLGSEKTGIEFQSDHEIYSTVTKKVEIVPRWWEL